ncbi:predicted protein [Micromonas commoda]|uniref:SHSP domain-containing protein n=1 Tax=Micromonas commoda (strain RCC299 / NOUM17 / CCMP2709) TaxID=296587 RepID=C1FHI6_MICCC|nr:predicted protein [Micromonas commoda]ACO70106.1 predicted protein [Micromonas commoda]|eukprot:XP_002508848.1 predicted protein [Micromonas commoda]
MALSPLVRGSSDLFFRDAFREADDVRTPSQASHTPMLPRYTNNNAPSPRSFLENKDGYTLKADMPGTKKENISLEVDGNIIRIGVSEDEGVTEESESPDKKWHRSERREFHSFQSRALRMPENTDFSKIESKYENGTLQIDVKKQPTPKHPEPKKISIK